jgi:hypothetical protein
MGNKCQENIFLLVMTLIHYNTARNFSGMLSAHFNGRVFMSMASEVSNTVVSGSQRLKTIKKERIERSIQLSSLKPEEIKSKVETIIREEVLGCSQEEMPAEWIKMPLLTKSRDTKVSPVFTRIYKEFNYWIGDSLISKLETSEQLIEHLNSVCKSKRPINAGNPREEFFHDVELPPNIRLDVWLNNRERRKIAAQSLFLSK